MSDCSGRSVTALDLVMPAIVMMDQIDAILKQGRDEVTEVKRTSEF